MASSWGTSWGTSWLDSWGNTSDGADGQRVHNLPFCVTVGMLKAF